MPHFVSVPKKGHPDALDVSRYGKAPWNRLSPFHLYAARIPVPGTFRFLEPEGEDMLRARSVEGIWQGLKRIGGRTAPELLAGKARKRRGRPEGHEFGYRLLSYVDAKALIYIPSYLYVLEELEVELIEELRGREGEVALADVSYQPDCLGPKPISHAALLADYLNGELEPYRQAQKALVGLAGRMEARYEQEPAEGLSWIDAELREIQARVLEIGSPELRDYPGCAALYEREALMLTAMHATGCHQELERSRELLDSWVAAGILSRTLARELSYRAPVCRFQDSWYSS